MNTRYNRKKSREYTKKNTRKTIKENTKTHKYFINYCRYDNQNLDYSFLTKYLSRLGCMPDKIMDKIRMRYIHVLKTHKNITADDLCNFTHKARQLAPINDRQISS